MATVKVQRVKGKNPVTKEEFYYVRAKSMGIMSTDDLVENIVREGQIPRIYAQGVLDYLTTAMFDYMKAGLAVQIPGLGTMRLNVTSKAQTNEKDATARTITGTKLRLYPFEKTRQEMKNFRFELIGETVESNGEEDEDEIPVGPGESTGNQTPGEQTPTEPQEYTVTWMSYAGSTPLATQRYKVGDTIVAPEPPAGYDWNDYPVKMPARDLTIYPVHPGAGI